MWPWEEGTHSRVLDASFLCLKCWRIFLCVCRGGWGYPLGSVLLLVPVEKSELQRNSRCAKSISCLQKSRFSRFSSIVIYSLFIYPNVCRSSFFRSYVCVLRYGLSIVLLSASECQHGVDIALLSCLDACPLTPSILELLSLGA